MAVHYNQQDEHARLLEQRQGQDYEAGRQQGNENDGGPQGQPEYGSDDEHRVPDPPYLAADLAELRRRIQRLEQREIYSSFDVDTSNELCIQLKNLLNLHRRLLTGLVTYPHFT